MQCIYTYTPEKLKEIISLHEMWLQKNPEGVQADLRGANLSEADLRWANLSGANLREADLSGANLSWANLSGADLRGANLSGANLRGANLSEADLRWANLSGANLREADLSGANLSWANLSGADLRGANLSGANLRGANLSGADLRGASGTNTVIYDENTVFFALQCPEKGSYIAYKKAGDFVVELEIPAEALRSSATTRKCRASMAKVLSITDMDGKPAGLEQIESDYDSRFVYVVGQMISVPDFCEDRWDECAAGIHHFITRREAVLYK
ncbi:pentapeptide repeat-containing protein [Oscillospiraceae bacterium 38-13]